jgi:hypothetical protein
VDWLLDEPVVGPLVDKITGQPFRALGRAAQTPLEYLVRHVLDLGDPETYNPWARSEPGRYALEEAEYYGKVAGALEARGLPSWMSAEIQRFGAVEGAGGEVLLNLGTILGLRGGGGGAGSGRVVSGRVVTTGSIEGGEVGAQVAGRIPGAVGPPQIVILDTNAVIEYRRALALLKAGESPVMTRAAAAELRGLMVRAARGEKSLRMPGIASQLEVIAESGSPQVRIAIREIIERTPGHTGALFPDGAIGGTALDLGRPLITFDKDLAEALRLLRGEVRP